MRIKEKDWHSGAVGKKLSGYDLAGGDFLRFMGNDIFGGLIDGRMYPARILVILCKPAAMLLDRWIKDGTQMR